ncbi:STAS domain-containing protein [Cryptosporangium minutisporangium]|uniref:STAS domain-containing protein n=1 Tax=Cryptosporangium minutisporangium TaxID=113569 RepID=A0ABP6T824_9ACTN
MMRDEVRIDGQRPEIDCAGAGLPPAAATVAVSELHGDDRQPDDPPEQVVTLVAFAGEIDLGTAPALGETVPSRTTDAAAVLLDLSAVTFLDSAGVRLLDNLVRLHEGRGTAVRLVAPEHGVARFTLTLCAFRSELIESTVAAARASLR